MADKSNRLSIFLIKPEYDTFDKIVIEKAISSDIEGVGTFYCENSHPDTPEWVKNFGNYILDKAGR